jgi:hypothetical protein
MGSNSEWKPSPATDAAVREWMKAQGLRAGSTRYYPDEEVYAWRHEAEGRSSSSSEGGAPTLWIARTVLEDDSPKTLLAALDRLGVGDRMRTTPKRRFMVVQEDKQIHVKPWGHGADRAE